MNTRNCNEISNTANIPNGFELRLEQCRGAAEHGWLSSRHSFSFANYYDPKHMGFSDLFVINEDRVKPGRGFGEHPHKNVEIFSYVLEGTLEHRDSMGTHGFIHAGDVQFMSAGSGVRHSEFNASKTQDVHFLQIWLATDQMNAIPTYQQQHFDDAAKNGKLVSIIAPEHNNNNHLTVRQDTRVYAGKLHGDQSFVYSIPTNRHTYVHVVKGTLKLNGLALKHGDGVKVRVGPETLAFTEGENAEVLVFDLRPQGFTELRDQ